jgi:hypothetical protein
MPQGETGRLVPPGDRTDTPGGGGPTRPHRAFRPSGPRWPALAALVVIALIVVGVLVNVLHNRSTTVTGNATLPTWNPSEAVQPKSTGPQIFVDCNANQDAAEGTSAHPFQNLQALSQHGIAPDTTVSLKRGCTWSGGLKINPNSTGVTLQAYGDGAAPMLTGDGLDRRRAVLDIEAERVTVSGLHIANHEGAGVQIADLSARVDDMEIDNTAFGMQILGPQAKITRVKVHDLHMFVNTQGGSDDVGAVGFDVQADDVTIEASSCTNCRAPSYDFGFDGGFAEVYNHGDRLHLIGNTATNVQGILEVGGHKQDSGAHDVVIQNNVFRETHGGIWVHINDQFAIDVGTISLLGNTIVNTASGTILGGNVASLVVKDNTIVAPGQLSAGGAPGTHTGNHYYLSKPSSLGFDADASETVGAIGDYQG